MLADVQIQAQVPVEPVVDAVPTEAASVETDTNTAQPETYVKQAKHAVSGVKHVPDFADRARAWSDWASQQSVVPRPPASGELRGRPRPQRRVRRQVGEDGVEEIEDPALIAAGQLLARIVEPGFRAEDP